MFIKSINLEYESEKAMATHSSTLAWKSHGQRSLVGCSPWGHKESDTTEQLHFHFSVSCTGEGNGNPLQYSCLKNPRDGWAWWAAVYGVAQSRTYLKRLSSSSRIWMLLISRFYVVLKISEQCKIDLIAHFLKYILEWKRKKKSEWKISI